MGACYSVTLKAKIKDEKGVVKVLNEFIANDTRTNYSLDLYKAQGIGTETFDDLMRIFLAGWKHQEVTIEEKEGFRVYKNDFNASYGWEGVMMRMFHEIAPFMEDGSELLIWPDSSYDLLVVGEGEVVQLH